MQIVSSDQELHCLHTRISTEMKMKKQSSPDAPSMDYDNWEQLSQLACGI